VRVYVIIRHKKFVDVCFEVLRPFSNTFYGRWINMGYCNSWYLPVKPDNIVVEDKTEWEKLDETWFVPDCFRYGRWIPL
jgi:hypothetical protein